MPLAQDVTTVVLQHATACKTMFLGMLNQFFDALFHTCLETVDEAANRVAIEAQRFHEVFDPLLAMYARDYLFLSAEVRLNYSKFRPSSVSKALH